MILKFELTGDFEPYGGVNLGKLNSSVALTLVIFFLGKEQKNAFLTLHNQIIFRCHFGKIPLPVGLTVHNFRANFAQKYDF